MKLGQGVLGVVLAFVAVLGSAGCPEPNAPVTCVGGESRNQLKCELPFSMDSFKVKGGLMVQQVGLNLETEKTALRQIDQGLQRYSLQAKTLCERYNACQVTREQYDKELADLNEVLALKERAEAAASAPPDSAERLAGISKAYRAFVPAADRKELSLSFQVLAARPLDMSSVPAQPCEKEARQKYQVSNFTPIVSGEAVPSGTRLRFDVKTSAQAYVYMFQRKQSGKVDLIFPQQGIASKNPLMGGAEVLIPNGTLSYCSDHNDIGEEQVYVVASLDPITSLESTLAKIDGGDKQAFENQFGATPPPPSGANCKQRALPLVDDGSAVPAPPSGGCMRQRGLPLVEDDAPAGAQPRSAPSNRASLDLRTEPADKVIVGIFRFDHQTPADYEKRRAR
jgi:hypothetical protein